MSIVIDIFNKGKIKMSLYWKIFLFNFVEILKIILLYSAIIVFFLLFIGIFFCALEGLVWEKKKVFTIFFLIGLFSVFSCIFIPSQNNLKKMFHIPQTTVIEF